MLIELIIMQPIDLCNLNCSYCYLPGRRNPQLMSDEVLEASFKGIFKSHLVKPITTKEKLKFVWHSGEPLAAGINFYEKALRFMNMHNTNKINVSFDFQSNATLINKQWCKFIKENGFSLSISVDGPEFIHDKYRRNWQNKGSHQAVTKGIEHLRDHNLPLHAICVLTHHSLDYPEEIYYYFKNNGFKSLALNIDEKECFNNQSSMDAKGQQQTEIISKYQRFMSAMYELWNNDKGTLRIREFHRIHEAINFRKKYGYSHYLPNMESLAFSIVSITKDGNISTFSPELSGGTLQEPHKFVIGNVLKIDSLDDVIKNQNFQQQLVDVKNGIKQCAKTCNYFDFCGGGSPSNKFYENGSFDSTETSFCILTQKTLFDLVVEKLSNTKEQLYPSANKIITSLPSSNLT